MSDTPVQGFDTKDISEPEGVGTQPDFSDLKVLLVCEKEDVLNELSEVLSSEPYQITNCARGAESIELVKAQKPEIVFCHMALKSIEADKLLLAISDVSPQTVCIVITARDAVLPAIDVINTGRAKRVLVEPLTARSVKQAFNQMLRVFIDEHSLQHQVDRLTLNIQELEKENREYLAKLRARVSELKQAISLLERAGSKIKAQYLFAVKSLFNLIELRSAALGAHCLRVAELSRCLAREMGIDEAEIKHIYHAALLHDLGKIGLSDAILSVCMSDLDGESRVLLSKHSQEGFDAVKMLLHDHEVATLIRHHHERFDGKGLPDGLLGSAIPLGSRIIAVAEDYDELRLGWVSHRKLNEAEALDFLRGASNKRYDPQVVKQLPQALENLKGLPKEFEKIVTGATLTPGMVITRDLKGHEEVLLVAKDGVVTEAVINHILEEEKQRRQTVKVYVHKYDTKSVKRRATKV